MWSLGLGCYQYTEDTQLYLLMDDQLDTNKKYFSQGLEGCGWLAFFHPHQVRQQVLYLSPCNLAAVVHTTVTPETDQETPDGPEFSGTCPYMDTIESLSRNDALLILDLNDYLYLITILNCFIIQE